MNDILDTFARHAGHIAFQFSGGRDSTAALYWMRELWPRMRVYHLYTGDGFPETMDVVSQVARDVPIITVPGDSIAVRTRYGLPSDLVPVDNLDVGRALTGRTVPIISRFDCCWKSLMQPLHQRMLDDGITLIVRGTRASDFAGAPVTRSGFTDGQVEILHPIEDWSDEEVMEWIAFHDLPVAPFYHQGMTQAPECLGCTAWWGEGRMKYLRDNHPGHYEAVRANMRTIRREIDSQLATLDE